METTQLTIQECQVVRTFITEGLGVDAKMDETINSIVDKMERQIDMLENCIGRPHVVLLDFIRTTYGVTLEDIQKRNNRREICDIRSAFCQILLEKGYKQKRISQLIKRDHAVIAYNRHRHECLYGTCYEYTYIYNQLSSIIL